MVEHRESRYRLVRDTRAVRGGTPVNAFSAAFWPNLWLKLLPLPMEALNLVPRDGAATQVFTELAKLQALG